MNPNTDRQDPASVHEGEAGGWTAPGAEHDPGSDGPPSALDDFTSGIRAWLELGLTIGEKLDRAEASSRKTLELWKALQRNTPINYGAVAVGTFVTGTPLLLNLGTPDQGTFWEVQSFVLGGTELNIAATGTAGLYVAGLAQVVGAGITNAADYLPALPAGKQYGTRQIVVNDQEYLFALVFGGTNGQQYGANCSVTVRNVAAESGQSVDIS